MLGYNLLAGNGFTNSGYPELHFTPLYPMVAGLFHALTGNFEMASNLAYALFGGLLVFPVFVIAQRIYGLNTAALAAVLTAIFPALTVDVLYWGSLTEPLYLSLLYGALAFLLVALEDDRPGLLAAAGALLGLAYLTRPEAVVYFGVYAIVASVWLLKARTVGPRRIWIALGAFVLPFVVLAAPYIWYLHVHTGQWLISGKLTWIWQQLIGHKGHDFDPTAWLSLERFHVNTLQSVLTDPADTARRIMNNGRKIIRFVVEPSSLSYGLTPVILLAFFSQPWDRQRVRHEAFLITIVLVLILTFLPFFFGIRLFAPAFPVLLIWTAQGALSLGRWLQETVELWRETALPANKKSMLGWLPAGMLTGLLIVTIPIVADRRISQSSFGDKEAGLWLKAHTAANAKVMATDNAVALYADRRWVPSPNTDWATFIQYAHTQAADFVVVDLLMLEYQPRVAKIVQQDHAELELVASFEEPYIPGLTTHVYRFSKSSDQHQPRGL
jgi:4-amino-4-deoxy-L-arabinose transferase-like glycosyltransferase